MVWAIFDGKGPVRVMLAAEGTRAPNHEGIRKEMVL
jgi:hypothetical protein